MKRIFGLLIAFLFISSLNAQYTIQTIAGDSLTNWNGDTVNAMHAGFVPYGIAFDKHGNYFIADYQNNMIRKVVAYQDSSVMTRVAGDTVQINYSGDGGLATKATLWRPSSVAVDDSDNIYIADFGNNVIRKVNGITGIISTVAGNGTAGFCGDTGPAISACLNGPVAVALDTASGDIYIADEFNNAIRKVNKKTGIITTVAGYEAIQGYTGDKGPAANAEMRWPTAVKLDKIGNIYIADNGNSVVRMVSASTGIITTVAGGGINYGQDSLATRAMLSDITDIAVDSYLNLYIADDGDGKVREVNHASGLITDVAGGGAVYNNNCSSFATALSPFGLAFGSVDTILYEADGQYSMVRNISGVEAGIGSLQAMKGSMNVYPNPCKGVFTLDLLLPSSAAREEPVLLEIFDVRGILAFNGRFSKTTAVNTEGWAPGLYAVRITGPSFAETKRLVVIK